MYGRGLAIERDEEMIRTTRRIQRAFVVAYNAPRAREEFPEGGEERIVLALDAVLTELQTQIEGIRLTGEEWNFVERMMETGGVDHGFAGSVAVIMSRLGRESSGTSEIPPEGRHRECLD